MLIDDQLITRLSEISCITLTDSEKDRLKTELQEALNNMADFTRLNTQGVPECSNVLGNTNVFREDEVQPSFDRELILKNAPFKNNEMFIAPKTIG